MRFFLAFFLCLFLSAQACAKTQELTVALEEWPASFNPALRSGTLVFSVGAQLFAGLTRLDEKGNAVPYLAEKWDLSADRKTYVFYLRSNAFFHDNSKITADDVVFSINFSRANHPFHPFLENIREVKKTGDYVLSITLKNPMENFPTFLIPILVPILPAHYYTRSSVTYPLIGSGPFCIESFEENIVIRMKKFDKFFLKDSVRIDRLNFKIFFDFYEIFYALKNNDVDMFMFYSCNGVASYIDAFDMEQVDVMPMDLTYPYMVVTYNMRKPLFQDIRVRRALALALDKEKLAGYYGSDSIKPVNGGMPHTNPYYAPTDSEFDIDEANRLLDEAGYPRDRTGKRFSVTLDYLAYSYMSDIIHWIQQEWSKNLGVELLLRDRNVFANVGNESIVTDFDLFFDELLLWHDPFIGMYRLYTEKNVNRYKLWTNVGAYKNSEMEDLFEAVSKEENLEKKKALYARIQKVLANDYASLWLISNMYYVVTKKNVKGMEALPYKMMSPMLNVTVQ